MFSICISVVQDILNVVFLCVLLKFALTFLHFVAAQSISQSLGWYSHRLNYFWIISWWIIPRYNNAIYICILEIVNILYNTVVIYYIIILKI